MKIPAELNCIVSVLLVANVNTAVVNFDQQIALPPDTPMTRNMIDTIADRVAVHTKSAASNLICLADAPVATEVVPNVLAA